MNLGSQANEIIVLLIPFGFFGLVLAMVIVGSKEKQVKARYRAEVQKEFLSKFSSGHELTEFLKAEGSEAFCEAVTGMPAKTSALETTLNAIGLGIILLSIGIGLLVLSFAPKLSTFGVLLTAAGIGILICVVVGGFLTRKWAARGESTPPAGSKIS